MRKLTERQLQIELEREKTSERARVSHGEKKKRYRKEVIGVRERVE